MGKGRPGAVASPLSPPPSHGSWEVVPLAKKVDKDVMAPLAGRILNHTHTPLSVLFFFYIVTSIYLSFFLSFVTIIPEGILSSP